ncbi:MAG: hypothetical protein KAR38_12440, partial [Calditrichia bacterium]|nr:hypothetical protein [Calditrichia bacterium]
MFRKILINKKVKDDVADILKKFPSATVHHIENEDEIFNYIKNKREAKKILYLSYLPGSFVKSCPGTDKTYRCCQYYIINEMTNCPLDCSYCILQFYLELPVITYYLNIAKMLTELKDLANKFPKRIIRLGTGELTDSLALDKYFNTNQKIIEEVDSLPNIVFEVKTKTDRVEHLISIAGERVVFSWSVNPEDIIKKEEHLTASLPVRLNSMKKIVNTPAKIGFHFDPIIYYENWESGYNDLITKLAATVPQQKIAWISMGSFRHPSDLRYKMIENHPGSILTAQESITGMDGKTRYPKKLRRKMYIHIYNLLRKHFGDEVFIYFCMESPEIWEDVMGKIPASNEELDLWFAKSLYSKFPNMNLPKPEKEF